MTSPSRVLIVDRSPESREVLRLLVERAGAVAVEANRPEQAIPLADNAAVDLIVLDADSDATADHGPSRDLGKSADRTDTPIVVLGAQKRKNQWVAADQVLPKPYHYGPLIRRIEDALAARRVA